MPDFDGQGKKEASFKELVKTMENISVDNKMLHDKMLEIMKEKEENEEKFVGIIKQIKDIFGIQPEKSVEFDGTKAPAPVAHYTVAKIARNVSTGFVNSLLKRTGLEHAYGYFCRAIKPSFRDSVGVGVDERKDSEELDMKKRNKIVDDNERIGCEREYEKTLFDKIKNTEEKETLENSYMKKSGSTSVNNKGVMNAENLPRSCSSTTNLKTMVIIEDTERLDDDKLNVPLSDSVKTVVKDNRLLIEPSDSFGNINKDLTGYNMNEVETSTPLDLTGVNDNIARAFVFSGAKKHDSVDTEDEVAEQSMLSLMTFEQKKVYFAQKIKAEQEAAMKGNNTPCKVDELKSPALRTNPLFQRSSLLPPSNFTTKLSEGEPTDHHQNDELVRLIPDEQSILEEEGLSPTSASIILPNEAQSMIPSVKIPTEEEVEDGASRGGVLLLTTNTAASSHHSQEERIRAL